MEWQNDTLSVYPVNYILTLLAEANWLLHNIISRSLIIRSQGSVSVLRESEQKAACEVWIYSFMIWCIITSQHMIRSLQIWYILMFILFPVFLLV